MLRQKVNLYQEEFRPAKEPFSATLMAAVIAGFFSLFIIASMYQIIAHQGKEQRLTKLQTLKQAKQQELDQELKKLSAEKTPEELEKILEEKRREYRIKRALIRYIEGADKYNTSGFYRYMRSLANQHIDGIWLTEIQLRDGGSYIALQGNTLKAELLPRYLTKLGNEESFSGITFETLEVIRPEDEQGYIGFLIQTEGKKTSEEDEDAT